jgi:hypothetical protein
MMDYEADNCYGIETLIEDSSDFPATPCLNQNRTSFEQALPQFFRVKGQRE